MRNLEQEAASLTRRFEGRNRAAFARETRFPGGQAMIYQNITGRKPISLDGAIAYAKGFACPIAEISPYWAQVISALPLYASEPVNGYSKAREQNASACGALSPLQSELLEITARLSETGLAILVGRAHEIALQHPASNQKTK